MEFLNRENLVFHLNLTQVDRTDSMERCDSVIHYQNPRATCDCQDCFDIGHVAGAESALHVVGLESAEKVGEILRREMM